MRARSSSSGRDFADLRAAASDPLIAVHGSVALLVQTRWLDADAYASVVVIEETETGIEVPLDLNRYRALQLLARASRTRRRRIPTPVRGQLALLR